MRRALPVLGLMLAGCQAPMAVSVGSAGASAAPSASANIYIQTGPYVGTLVGLGFIAGFLIDQEGHAVRAAPELDPSRRVQEQDCSKPIENATANLRCR